MPLTQAEMEWQLRRLPVVRATCRACNGNPDRCRNGSLDGGRLEGCRAFTDSGEVRVPAKPSPAQPWEIKRAA